MSLFNEGINSAVKIISTEYFEKISYQTLNLNRISKKFTKFYFHALNKIFNSSLQFKIRHSAFQFSFFICHHLTFIKFIKSSYRHGKIKKVNCKQSKPQVIACFGKKSLQKKKNTNEGEEEEIFSTYFCKVKCFRRALYYTLQTIYQQVIK